ncbi:MAG: heme exporter protein CcmD [Hellea sp.]|nr:heme exporter protein CcmD [Hellea sp.]
MFEFGEKAAFIWSSYGISALGILGLIIFTFRRGRRD